MASPSKTVPTVDVYKGSRHMIVNVSDLEELKENGWSTEKGKSAPASFATTSRSARPVNDDDDDDDDE